MKRHGNESVRERRLVEVDGVDAVGQEHCHAGAARKTESREGVTPTQDLVERFLEGDVAPTLRRGIPLLVDRIVGTLVEMMGEQFGERGEEVERFDALAAAVVFFVDHGFS